MLMQFLNAYICIKFIYMYLIRLKAALWLLGREIRSFQRWLVLLNSPTLKLLVLF